MSNTQKILPFLHLHKCGTVHENVRNHKCHKCEASFAQKGNLQVHLAKVHDNQERFQCELCEKSFTYKKKP